MNEAINNSIWFRCRTCASETGHTVRSEYLKIATPEEVQSVAKNGQWRLYAWTMSQVLECGDCGRPCFRHGWTFTPHLECTWVWRIYTNPEEQWSLPAMHGLPTNVSKLYRETWQAFDCGALTLATAGMRAVVEAVCSDRHCKGADLQQKIRKLNGVLSVGDVSLLQTHRMLGNEAIHQMQTPSAAELTAALDVLEHLLKTLYELPRRAEELKRLRTERLSGHSLSLLKAS
jgi:hypothetical protein